MSRAEPTNTRTDRRSSTGVGIVCALLSSAFAALLMLPVSTLVFERPAWTQGFGAGREDDSVFRNRRNRDSRRSERQAAPDYPPAVEYEAGEEPPEFPAGDQLPPEPPPAPAPRPQQPPVAVPQPGVPGAPPGLRPLPPNVRPPVPGQQPVPGQPPTGEQVEIGIPPQGDIVLRLAPLQQLVEVDQIVPLHVWLDNPEEKPFNIVSLAISYDPNVLEFIDAPEGEPGKPNSYDQSEKTVNAFRFVRDPNADRFYLNEADVGNGMVYYRARCASGEVSTSHGFLLSMKFRVRSAKERSPIRFLFSEWPEAYAPPIQSDQQWEWPSPMTFVGYVDPESASGPALQNVLGSKENSKDGVISGGLTVLSENKEAVLENRTAVPEGVLQTRILLDPPLQAVEAGNVFDVDVRIENPEKVPWDRVRLDIRFDPRYLEVVDQDEGNWLTIGTNILDGPYHNRFPFDWVRENSVRKNEGRILYENGVFNDPFDSGGVIATIRFLALAAVSQTPILFDTDASATSRSGTRISYRRSDVLGDTSNPQDGVAGAVVSIVPRRDFQSADIDPGP